MSAIRFREVVECSLCGSSISLEDDLHFGLEEHAALCFACAVSRGGVYEHAKRDWLVLPDVSGIGAVPAHAARRYRAAIDSGDSVT